MARQRVDAHRENPFELTEYISIYPPSRTDGNVPDVYCPKMSNLKEAL